MELPVFVPPLTLCCKFRLFLWNTKCSSYLYSPLPESLLRSMLGNSSVSYQSSVPSSLGASVWRKQLWPLLNHKHFLSLFLVLSKTWFIIWSAQGGCRCIHFVFSEQLYSLLYSQRTQNRMQWLPAGLRYSWELANLIIQESSFSLSQCYDTLLLHPGAKSCKQWGCIWNRKGKGQAAPAFLPTEQTLALRSAYGLVLSEGRMV